MREKRGREREGRGKKWRRSFRVLAKMADGEEREGEEKIAPGEETERKEKAEQKEKENEFSSQ